MSSPFEPLDKHEHAALARLRALPSPAPLDAGQLAAIEQRLSERIRGRGRRSWATFLVAGVVATPLAFAATLAVWRAGEKESLERKPLAPAAAAPTPSASPAPPPRELATPPSGAARPRTAVNQLAEESKLVSLALTLSRQEGDDVAALKVLDRYRRRFPRGELRAEAPFARAEALYGVGRYEEAAEEVERYLRAYPAGRQRERVEALRARLIQRSSRDR